MDPDERPIKPMDADLQKWMQGEGRDDNFDWDDPDVQGDTEEVSFFFHVIPPLDPFHHVLGFRDGSGSDLSFLCSHAIRRG